MDILDSRIGNIKRHLFILFYLFILVLFRVFSSFSFLLKWQESMQHKTGRILLPKKLVSVEALVEKGSNNKKRNIQKSANGVVDCFVFIFCFTSDHQTFAVYLRSDNMPKGVSMMA